ncbi:MAG: hypothetical protein DI535_21390 [Citrobacter freundii]|nr:MAG: hypothetical protein DI535_21390 [Citrobacter freundii]
MNKKIKQQSSLDWIVYYIDWRTLRDYFPGIKYPQPPTNPVLKRGKISSSHCLQNVAEMLIRECIYINV